MQKLNIGCGDRKIPGFVNVDIRAEVDPDYVAEASGLYQFTDGSFDIVYAGHVLEHVRRCDVGRALEEWNRVLVSGGTLYVAVPNLKTLFNLYVYSGVSLLRLMGLLYGGQTYPENTHYCGWDYETLAYALQQAGFFNIRKFQTDEVFPEEYLNEHGYHDFAHGEINEICISLNVAATKI